MGSIGEFDALYCCHCLEHLYSHDVPKALAEFKRVLKPGAAALIRVPDLEDIRPTEEMIYESAIGPITGLDMYFGHRGLVELSPYMAHHCGFTKAKMEEVLEKAGFSRFEVQRAKDHFELFAVAVR
jgi:ubiquinone/menaquinone biosynthesis C-methylase UbiE